MIQGRHIVVCGVPSCRSVVCGEAWCGLWSDRGGGIWDFQHCIVITRGQEERIPKTASVVGTINGLRSFLLWLYMFFLHFFAFFVFFLDFLWFCCDLVILGSYFDILGILGIWDTCAVFVFHLSLSFFFLESFAELCFISYWGGTRKNQ